MSDDNHAPVKKKVEETTVRLNIELKESADSDSYVHVDFLELTRDFKSKLKEKKDTRDVSNDDASPTSDDSHVEALARFYEEKYGTGDDYAELGDGYDEEDSFIDNADAIRDHLPSGVQAEFGGFYINRGKLVFVKEDSSSSSDHAEQFVQQAKRNTRRITSESEEDGKRENGRVVDIAQPIKNRKRSGEFFQKNKNPKKFRKMATPKIPEHLLQKKPFSGSEFTKNIKEIKKNRLKNVDEADKASSDNAESASESLNTKRPFSQIPSKKAGSGRESPDELDEVIEAVATGTATKPTSATVAEAIEAVATGADLKDTVSDQDDEDKRERNKDKEDDSSSSTTSSSSSSSDSDSESSSRTSEKTVPSPGPGKSPARPAAEVRESVISRGQPEYSNSAPAPNHPMSLAALDDSIKQLVKNISEASQEERCRASTQRLNKLLLSLDDILDDRPQWEKDVAFNEVALLLNAKKNSIIKKAKKLKFSQLEYRMSLPMRRLKEAVAERIPRLESEYFKEFTSATGTRIDSSSPPRRKFVWDDTLRSYLHEIVRLRQSCYQLVRPRKESVSEYVLTFLEFKVKPFWPKEWMTMEILLREVAVGSNALNGPGSSKMNLPRLPSAATLKKLPPSTTSLPKPRKAGPVGKAMLLQRQSSQPTYTPSTLQTNAAKLTAPSSQPSGRTKTIEFPSAVVIPPIGVRTSSPKGLTISPIKDNLPVDAEILNLTKNSSVSISKVGSRSDSPNISVPLPAGTTISPAGPTNNFSSAISLIKHDSKNREDCLESKALSISKEVTLIKHEPITSAVLSREVEISIAKPVSPHKDAWRETSNYTNKDKVENLKDIRKDAINILTSNNLPPSLKKPNYNASKHEQWQNLQKSEKASAINSQEPRSPIESRKEVSTKGNIECPREGSLVIKKMEISGDSRVRPVSQPLSSTSDSSDKYKNMSIRKRAVQEYFGQQNDLNLEKSRTEVHEKGLNTFPKVQDFDGGSTAGPRKGSISVKKFASAPVSDLNEEMHRVMQNIVELQEKNTDGAAAIPDSSANFNHAFKNKFHS